MDQHHTATAADSDPSIPNSLDKETGADHIEAVRTISRVPGNDHYYEKDGLRTYGDDEDHDHEPPMTMNRLMSLIAMAFLWTGSQIPVYLFGKLTDLSQEQELIVLQVAFPLTFTAISAE